MKIGYLRTILFACAVLTSTLAFAQPANDNCTGAQVWISVLSNSGGQGSFNLCINSTTPPPAPGNSCATATTLCDKSSFSLTPFPNNSNAFVPSCWFAGGLQRPVFYKFTVGTTG